MDEMHESESTAGGGQAPPDDVATGNAEKPYTAHFTPAERPAQAGSPAPPEDDGFPGGPLPESSGFSWRLPGQQAPVQQAQGGIPNEFDHLFRDAPADGRRSLMPNQGTIGVSLPGGGSYAGPGYRQNPATRAPGAAGPGPGPAPAGPDYGPGPAGPGPDYGTDYGPGPGTDYGPGPGGRSDYGAGPGARPDYGPQPTQALPPVDATDRQGPVYQPPTQDQIGYGQQMPSRAYDSGGYSAQGQGPVNPESHTQAIPRVPAQPQMYGGANNGGMNAGNPDLLLAAGPDRRQSNRTLLIALGVFVVLIVVAAVAFSGGGGGKSKAGNAGKATKTDTPPPTTSTASAPPGVDPAAKAQADAIVALMSQSHALRAAASDSITAVQQCKNVAANKATFTDVAAKRQAQADGMKPLAVDKLPGGQKLQQDLINAWQLSAESERDYVAWANDNLSCTGKPGANDNYTKGNSAGDAAGRAKSLVVKEWNAFASSLGEQTIEVSNL